MSQKFESADPVAEAAAMWLARHDRGLTAQEQVEFNAWQAASPLHQEEWTSMSSTWTALNTAESAPDLVAEAAAVEQRTRGTTRSEFPNRWILSWVAAAAVLAIGFFLGRQTPPANASSPAPSIVLIAAEAKRIALSDGSVVETRGDSDVKFAIGPTERRVRLNKGEAFFTVAHDPARPFIVEANDVVVRAVGTAFNVRRDSGRVDVMVTEGRVRLATSTEPITDTAPLLDAGAGAHISNNANALSVETRALSPVELDSALAWRSPLLEFSRASLDEVLDAFRQHSPHHVRLGDPELGKRRISGTFQANNVEGFLRFGESMLGLRVERAPNGDVILHTAS